MDQAKITERFEALDNIADEYRQMDGEAAKIAQMADAISGVERELMRGKAGNESGEDYAVYGLAMTARQISGLVRNERLAASAAVEPLMTIARVLHDVAQLRGDQS